MLKLETHGLDFRPTILEHKSPPDTVLASFHMKTPVEHHILQSRHARATLFLTYTLSFFTNRRIHPSPLTFQRASSIPKIINLLWLLPPTPLVACKNGRDSFALIIALLSWRLMRFERSSGHVASWHLRLQIGFKRGDKRRGYLLTVDQHCRKGIAKTKSRQEGDNRSLELFNGA